MAAIISYPPVNLTNRRDWDSWIPYIQHISTSYGVWDYINPDQPYHLLIEPTNPVDNPQLEITNDVFNRYKLQLDQYNNLKSGLVAADATIMKSITAETRHQIQRSDTIRGSLRYLSDSYRLSTVEWRSVLQTRITKQCPPDPDTDLMTGAYQLITIGQDAVEAGIPGVTEIRLRDTFLHCTGKLDYAFAASHNHIPETDPQGNVYTLRYTIRAWNMLRCQFPSACQDAPNHVHPPVSFDASGSSANSNSLSPCACGYSHRYVDCFYLVDSK